MTIGARTRVFGAAAAEARPELEEEASLLASKEEARFALCLMDQRQNQDWTLRFVVSLLKHFEGFRSGRLSPSP
jgi:hypothetical protein